MGIVIRRLRLLGPLAAILVLVAMGSADASGALSLYNAIVPVESGWKSAASDIAYGPVPRQNLDVYTPEPRKTAAPVVVIFYGGSWNSGRKEDYAFLGKTFAARGYVTIIADYRLVPEVRFPAFLQDGAKAIAWTREHAREYGGDPGRIFLLGHSAGAYNAAMLALDGRYLRAEGLAVETIRGVAALAGPFDFLPLDVDSTVAAFGRARDPAETQPVNFVSRSAPAMFLATGEDDTTVKPRNTAALAAKLQAAGRPATVRTYPGVGHIGIMLALSQPFRNRAPVLNDVIAFFKSRS